MLFIFVVHWNILEPQISIPTFLDNQGNMSSEMEKRSFYFSVKDNKDKPSKQDM